MLSLSFLGAAREVTGSCFLVNGTGARFLVDCGMVQGGRDAAVRNHKGFAFDPSSIDFVLLTHAHIDHSGLLPKLTREGFTGPIYTSEATADLLKVMLLDSARIQEGDAERRRRTRRNSDRNDPARNPLYTQQDARTCLKQVRALPYDTPFEPAESLTVSLRDAGHILGSAIIEVTIEEGGLQRKIVFSGDLGQPERPLVREPTPVSQADYLVIESTYGNRVHSNFDQTREELLDILQTTLRNGNLIIPAFAVGRTQEILYSIHKMACEGHVDNLKIFVDSPMATQVTRLTKAHFELFNERAKQLVQWHASEPFPPYLRFTESVEESRALNQIKSGAIIISASGMCEAGRIRHHLLHNLPRATSTVLIAGFQAQGTLGRKLVDGASHVRLFGNDIPVRSKIHVLNGLSAHADRNALLGWARNFREPPRKSFVVHGEEQSAQEFASSLQSELGWEALAPLAGSVFQLGEGGD
ncbi:MAG: MBL fold metallo-hydrolase [Sphingobium sp.]